MFSGIVSGLYSVTSLEISPGKARLGIRLPQKLLQGLEFGMSVSVSGVCLTVAGFERDEIFFDVITETLNCTALNLLRIGEKVNIERSLKYGDEVGGHQVSGHITGTARISSYEELEGEVKISFNCDAKWMFFLFEKGFIAIDGVSLTVGACFFPEKESAQKEGRFEVHLIPETLARTTLGIKRVGDDVNLEFDSQTVAVVKTIQRMGISCQ